MSIQRSLEEWSFKKERWKCVLLVKFLTHIPVSEDTQQVKIPPHLIAILRNVLQNQNQLRSLCIKGGESQMSRRSTPAPQRRKLLTKSLSVGDSLGSKFGLEWSFGVIIHARVRCADLLLTLDCRLADQGCEDQGRGDRPRRL